MIAFSMGPEATRSSRILFGYRPTQTASLGKKSSFILRGSDPAPTRLEDPLADEVGGDVGLDAVSQGAERRRDGHRGVAGAVCITDVGEVQHEAGRDSETTPAPARGHRQVDLSGKRVREIVERQGRLMGKDPGLLGPKAEHDEVLVLAGREVNDAVDATSHARHLPRRQVLVKEWTRIARLGGLS
ncbi:MAG: hypothetical protein K8F56_06105, partial [Rhodocyclaceae bacterium]|nr:hypothetical protein [Rhodocyclaceae bacterium]